MAHLVLGYVRKGNVFFQDRCVPGPFRVPVAEDELVVRHPLEFLGEQFFPPRVHGFTLFSRINLLTGKSECSR